MKAIRIIAAFTAFLILPIFQNLCAQETARHAPPIEQTLIREGDFAVKLVERLRTGTPQNEAEAEMMLSFMGISPKNGWISDYPVTPDIIGELQSAVGDAADTGKFPMGRDEALKIFQDLAAEVGLSVVIDRRTDYPSEEPPRAYSYYSEPTVTNYYNSYGPPIVTYIPPPSAYLYLYAWVPYPFWWTGVYFPGFYVLTNFHRCIYVHRRQVYISNHWRDPKTRRVFVIDPSKRNKGEFNVRRVVVAPRSPTSPEACKGAASMIEHQSSNNGLGNLSSHGVKLPQVRGSIDHQRISRPSTETGFPEREIGESNRFEGVDRPNGTIYPGVLGDQSRSYDPPTSSFGRSSIPPSHGGVDSFSPSNMGNWSSFGTSHGRTGGFGFGRGGR
jgi:hypothetical protein